MAKDRRKRIPNTHRKVWRSEKSVWPNISKSWRGSEQGFSQTAIAVQVGVGHATVSRWLRHGTFPEQKSPKLRTKLDPHLKAVAERWEAGCHNIAQLHRELVEASHTITYRNVYRQLVRYLPEGRKKSGSTANFHAPQCSHEMPCFSCFGDLRNWRLRTKKRWLGSDLCIDASRSNL